MALIESLAQDFQTTLTSTAIRLADVSKRKIIVIFHQNGRVRWSYSDPRKKLPFVIAGRPIPPFSSATLDPSEVAEGMDYYEDADWFPELSLGTQEVSEETRRMKIIEGGLTLLWFP